MAKEFSKAAKERSALHARGDMEAEHAGSKQDEHEFEHGANMVMAGGTSGK